MKEKSYFLCSCYFFGHFYILRVLVSRPQTTGPPIKIVEWNLRSQKQAQSPTPKTRLVPVSLLDHGMDNL